jgi:hypothetical protein
MGYGLARAGRKKNNDGRDRGGLAGDQDNLVASFRVLESRKNHRSHEGGGGKREND